MKKGIKYVIALFILAIVGFIYYYINLPAINIHSASFWYAIMFAIGVVIVMYIIRKGKNDIRFELGKGLEFDFKMTNGLKALIGLFAVVFVIYLIGNVLSSPFINAEKYQQLLTIQERNFTDDIKEVDYSTIPLLDKDSAALLGERKMGSMVDMVSQFEVSNDYAQINVAGKPVRVAPLMYANNIKWLTNQKEGIPAYIMIDMTTQDTECVKLDQSIRYSKSELFNRNIYRHLRFRYPTYIFDDQIYFEIDDNGTPYWVCPVKKFNIGLFGGQTIGNVILCNAITGETSNYEVEDVPQWVDKVYSAELLSRLYDYSGSLKHGYWNSVLGQKDSLRSTNGYNYIALDDDVWVYTGVTSVSGDQSNVGFVLMNQRTMETRFYKVEGAIEESAMSSAEGQVQNLGYRATFPLLLNIKDEPTYFMALKDGAGLVKKYAMVNVEKYQWVAIGDTIQLCEKNYNELLNTNGIVKENVQEYKTVSGNLTALAPVVIEGTTHYYLCIEGNNDIFDVDLSDEKLLSVIRFQLGDRITIKYMEGYGLHPVRELN